MNRLRSFLKRIQSFWRKQEPEVVTEHQEIDYGRNPKYGRRCVWCGVIRTPRESRYDRCKHCRKYKTRLDALAARERKRLEYLERNRRRRYGE